MEGDRQPCLVIGTGLAGLVAALAFSNKGMRVGLTGPAVTADTLARDTRSTALFGGSIHLLRHIGVWEAIAGGTAPLVGLRLIDATDALLRAPEVLFRSQEIGVDAFGYNIENGPLLAALWQRIVAHPGIRHHAANVLSVSADDDAAAAILEGGEVVQARLVVGADGAKSICRGAAGVRVSEWTYPQNAIATRFAHSRPHGGVSTEFHRRPGPMTTIPLPENASSLVWVETPAEAARLVALPEEGFRRELAKCLNGLFGEISSIGPRASFPLTGVQASPIGARRIALVGEAAHRLPPIGAQGLNLGLRDVAWLAEIAGNALASGGDPGSDEVLAEYDRARKLDVTSRAWATDALNRALIAGLLPTDMLRSTGLVALDAIPWLRRFVMREGVAPSGPQPSLLLPPAP